jgi:hypothetical protein
MDIESEGELLNEYEPDSLRLDGSAIPHKTQLLELANSARAFLGKEKRNARTSPKTIASKWSSRRGRILRRFGPTSMRTATRYGAGWSSCGTAPWPRSS